MQQSSSKVRSYIIYGAIGVAVLVLIVLGVTWSKNRSDQYAAELQSQQSTQNNSGDSSQNGSGDQGQGSGSGDQQQPNGQNGGQSGAGSTSGNGESTNEQGVNGAATTGSSQVPATGASDWVFVMAGAALAAYAFARFLQSRRATELK